MNILVINDMMYPDDMGGSGRYLREIYNVLSRAGHNIHIITRQWKPDQPIFENLDGLEVHRYAVNDSTTLSTIMSTVSNAESIFKWLIRKTQYDVINIHHSLTALNIINKKLPNTPAKVYTFHSPWHKEYEIKTEGSRSLLRGPHISLRKAIEQRVIRRCSDVIVLSRFMEEQLKMAHPCTSAEVTISPGGADINRFKPSPERTRVRAGLNLPERKIVLLTVRGLTPRTGVDNLVRAMPAVVSQNSNVHLIIGGGGILKDDLLRLTDKLGLTEHITFAGFVDDESLISYYQAADYFVLPTKYLEGFGLVTPEAMACGLPVLATPVGGTIEILRSFDRSLLGAGTSPDHLAGLILNHVGRGPEEWNELSRRCREYIEQNYSWELSAKKTENLFLQLKRNQKRL